MNRVTVVEFLYRDKRDVNIKSKDKHLFMKTNKNELIAFPRVFLLHVLFTRIANNNFYDQRILSFPLFQLDIQAELETMRNFQRISGLSPSKAFYYLDRNVYRDWMQRDPQIATRFRPQFNYTDGRRMTKVELFPSTTSSLHFLWA